MNLIRQSARKLAAALVLRPGGLRLLGLGRDLRSARSGDSYPRRVFSCPGRAGVGHGRGSPAQARRPRPAQPGPAGRHRPAHRRDGSPVAAAAGRRADRGAERPGPPRAPASGGPGGACAASRRARACPANGCSPIIWRSWWRTPAAASTARSSRTGSRSPRACHSRSPERNSHGSLTKPAAQQRSRGVSTVENLSRRRR